MKKAGKTPGPLPGKKGSSILGKGNDGGTKKKGK